MEPWLRNSLAAVAIVLLPMAVLLIDLPQGSVFWRDAGNAGHAPLFGLLAVILVSVLQRVMPRRHRLWPYWLALFLASGIGLLTELIQMIGPRDADLWDLLRDVGGALGFLLVYAAVDLQPTGRPVGRIHWPRAGLGVAIVCVAMLPIVTTSLAFLIRDAQFPRLTSFDNRLLDVFLETKDSRLEFEPAALSGFAEEGGVVAKLTCFPGEYPGLEFREPSPDWSGFDYLTFSVRSTSTNPELLFVRIHDRYHNGRLTDRYRRSFFVADSGRTVQIPLTSVAAAPVGRKMDLKHIEGVILFLHNTSDTLELYLSDIELKTEQVKADPDLPIGQ